MRRSKFAQKSVLLAQTLFIKTKQRVRRWYFQTKSLLTRHRRSGESVLEGSSCPDEDSLSRIAINTGFGQLEEMTGIDESIVLDRKILEYFPPGHPSRSRELARLATDLWNRYKRHCIVEDLEESISLDREVLELRPPGHADRWIALSNLAVHLSDRYKQLGAIEDINEAISLDRATLMLPPSDQPDRSISLNNLAVHLSDRYKKLGTLQDLNEAVSLARDSLALCPPDHPNRLLSLHCLSVHLSDRYKQLGTPEDLDEAITLNRDTLVLRQPGHPERSFSLGNLSVALTTRYKQLEAVDDLDEAITLGRESLSLCPPGHSERSVSLNNLAISLSLRYKHLGDTEDLDEAIHFSRSALDLRPPGHISRAKSLIALADHLYARYQQLTIMEDLEEALILGRDALVLYPLEHPDRSSPLDSLANYLLARYNRLEEKNDLDEAIVFSREALALRPSGHPNHSQSLLNLARNLRTRLTSTGQLKDREDLFNLYSTLALAPQAVSSSDVFSARAWTDAAEFFHHPTVVCAYETCLRLLAQHLASLPSLPRHLAILRRLTSSLAMDAFSACLRNHSATKAVELLEQGRGVFWSQLARLRSPLDDVIASGQAGRKLANDYKLLTLRIRNVLESPGDWHGQLCHLNLELQRVVANIQALPGFSHFLLPSLFSDLQQAASKGPVVIVNSSKYTCDALVVLVDRDPIHIPLSITKEDLQELAAKLRSLTVLTKSTNVKGELVAVLRELWDRVVSHIADLLQSIQPSQSRIWWCPTAEFSCLPLHAAGPYKKGQSNFASLYVSSYTPTLAALIRARRNKPTDTTEWKRFVAVGQANAAGENELPSVDTELANIGQRVDGLASFTCIQGAESSISRVEEELMKSQWVHFACHGIVNQKEPFKSAFALRDGHFTIQHIVQCELENPEFAYLSACHTTLGDEESPDEVIHLASAIQFAGFRSVIGTMWAVDDDETNKITSMFYDNIKDEHGSLDHTRAAFALHKTMKTVVDVEFDQRILYIHLGA